MYVVKACVLQNSFGKFAFFFWGGGGGLGDGDEKAILVYPYL